MSVTKQAKPQAIKPTTPTAVDPAAQLRASRDRLSGLQREESEIAGHIRSAILAEDGGRVSALTARQMMLPTLIARAAAALLPLELAALDEQRAAIADQERAHRAVTEQADRDREAASEALRGAQVAYNRAIVDFDGLRGRREDLTRQRHALRDRLARLIAADAPLPAA